MTVVTMHDEENLQCAITTNEKIIHLNSLSEWKKETGGCTVEVRINRDNQLADHLQHVDTDRNDKIRSILNK